MGHSVLSLTESVAQCFREKRGYFFDSHCTYVSLQQYTATSLVSHGGVDQRANVFMHIGVVNNDDELDITQCVRDNLSLHDTL